MSSTECELQDERPKPPGAFTYTWSIDNYSYCTVKEDSAIKSPSFEVQFLGDKQWRLELYPKGRRHPGFISCYFYQIGGNLPCRNCIYTLSIRKPNGQFKEGGVNIYNSSSEYENEYSKFVSLRDLKGPDGYLVNDTLTVRFRIWKTDVDLPLSVKCDVHSRIKISKLDYTWMLNGIAASIPSQECRFRHSLNITHFFKEIPTLKIHVFNEGNLGESAMHFGIEMGERKENFYFIICMIHLLDANERSVHSACYEHLFNYSKPSEIFNFPIISKDKFYANKDLYVPKGELTLRCELGFASDMSLETFVYRTTKDLELQPAMNNRDTDGHELWIKNVKEFYEDGKFSDFIIRTPSRQFSVSKNIICAQSVVFSRMFESDMKESKSGIVDIDDLDDGTVSTMLMYVYTNTIDFIDCSSALKLYFAADKYRITALQKKCSNYLMSFLDDSNVCEVLVLADTHQDHDLKSYARNFVHAHAHKVTNSESWKKLMETNPHLTSEIMQWVICNTF